MCLDRQLQCQPRFGVIQIDTRDLRNAIHAVLESVAVNEERFRRLAEVAVMREERLERCDEVAVLFFIVVRQRAECLVAERHQIGMFSHLE